ncbi:hypothetical protein MUK42_13500 [Musa troglodytarum]|uniref:Uncharacterized protein n=1 Tax=Musa troglodytarum TaxID=320322 RepID=A0A9E7KHK9_9LILI|nr:hypothetical protein MUK42_13500 [Musa troglodytarum]
MFAFLVFSGVALYFSEVSIYAFFNTPKTTPHSPIDPGNTPRDKQLQRLGSSRGENMAANERIEVTRFESKGVRVDISATTAETWSIPALSHIVGVKIWTR